MTEPTEKHDGRSELTSPTLIIYSREGTRAVALPEAGPLTVGRSADAAQVAIDDPSLSRLHARFVVAAGQIHVEDAGSTNGTFVRGQRVERAAITDGMEIRLGDVMVLVRDPSSAMWVAAGVDAYDGFVDRVEEELVRSKLLGHPLTLLYVVGHRGEPNEALVSHIKPALRVVDRVGLYASEVCLVLLPETNAATAALLRKTLEGKGLGVGAATTQGGSAQELVDRARASSGAAGDLGAEPRATGPVFGAPAMTTLIAELRRVATSQLSVLLRGETGTGKDVLATFVHEASGRRGPLRTVNCGAIAPALMESTLFGHERGAFTGAERAMPGLFEQANGGTVFLDEVGELSQAAQAALLRVLETHRVQRLGSDRETAVDVRVIAATHVDLLAAAQAGRFREDLFYRLEGIAVVVPPLRARIEEIDALVEHFIGAANERHGRAVTGIGPLARDVIRAYSFPGNVRELKNAIERAVVVTMDPMIDVDALPERMRTAALSSTPAEVETSADTGGDLRERVRSYERGLIERALAASGGNRNQAAEALGLPVRSLFYKLKELGLTER